MASGQIRYDTTPKRERAGESTGQKQIMYRA